MALRARALEVLRWTRPPGAVPALSRLALGTDTLVRFRAALALGRVGSRSAVEALGRLAQSPASDAREVAVWALGLASSDHADRVLIPFATAGNPRFRMLTAIALGRRGGVEALDTLETLSRDSDTRLRLTSLWAVALIADQRSVPVLVEALDIDDARAVRVAAWGLGRVGSPPALEALAARLWRSRPVAPGALAEALLAHGQRGDADGALAAGYAALADPRAGRLEVDLSPLLGLAQPPRLSDDATVVAIEEVAPLLQGRIAAVLTGSDRDALRTLLESITARDAGLALRPMLQVADPLAARLVAPHSEALLSCAGGVHGRVIRALGLRVASRLADVRPDAVDREGLRAAALDGLGSRDTGVRAASAVAVGRVTDGDDLEVAAALAATLAADTDGAGPAVVRRAVAIALGSLSPDRAVEPLGRLLRDDDVDVRIAATRSAARVASDQLLIALIDLVDDTVQEVAVGAVAALAVLHHADARATLVRVSTTGEPRVRARALEALKGRLDGRPAGSL